MVLLISPLEEFISCILLLLLGEMMVFTEATIDMGIAILIAVALAEYFKWRSKADKGFTWLALAGVWLVFAGATNVAAGGGAALAAYGLGGVVTGLSWLFAVIGWIFALVGTLFIAYQTLAEK